nr:type III-B CRISPR module RAMP protein Cmr4 [Candidatus Freyrarchaeum guaymaensis]
GVYAFATCPLLLRVFMDYLEVAGSLECDVEGIKEKVAGLMSVAPGEGKVLVESDVFTINGKAVLNEEFMLEVKSERKLSEFNNALGLGDAYKGRLVMVDDNIAVELVERSIQRVPRVKLEPGVKKVAPGALWTEENVPVDTVFHTVFMYSKPRGGNCKGLSDAESVKNRIVSYFSSRNGYLVIGGNETVGRGLVRLIFK